MRLCGNERRVYRAGYLTIVVGPCRYQDVNITYNNIAVTFRVETTWTDDRDRCSFHFGSRERAVGSDASRILIADFSSVAIAGNRPFRFAQTRGLRPAVLARR